ncbi:hypothetical protein K503DRAFT_826618 [Rhizopogon vinicolor AM-OR11-026]|uniref:Helicase ATP-binding domain-containing protein n=1 Tax=Rhizopogon vinicolor AM-OR11-026 TaxID=1314800 RepID=A0A1B7MU33_9AGAM|nr:hypothetical protein K503DRAFT_826618 [Rhizopogon vinicolor AM-OR11-026]
MVKAKSDAKGQKAITSFFGGKKESDKPKETKDDLEEASDDDIPAQSAKTDGKIESSTLPPIHETPAMFRDLVSRLPEFLDVAEHIKGRKLRVATMCSGTESPLLALELIGQVIQEEHGIPFQFEHVFSCEIEPFKQAYIERNFQPPLLFRDVCELGEPQATTAYGALAPVPGDVDLLVAGTSCVDYSNLNNEKKTIDGGGESGRTFHGMMSWVTNHRPPLVILENVCSAPWDRVKEYFEKHGYSAEHIKVDTKQYYIPHTRMRKYLLAVDKRGSSMPAKWKDLVVNKLKRPASSTLDAFLLPSDDSRIHQARQLLVRDSGGSDTRTGRTDWTRCESRHARGRDEEELGQKRPLTGWEQGGICRLPDFAWQDWGVRQVERVWDLMDISLLRSAKIGVDPSYKTLVWNLSQNVDRATGSSKTGICPCLTPSMIPYITNRGGPMIGLEALAMQGLPIDKLLLTRESQDELADLAGNAMSSTVVGACILSALVVGQKLLKSGNDKETYEMKKDVGHKEDRHAMDVDLDAAAAVDLEGRIKGHGNLVERPLDLTATQTDSITRILEDARKSVRLCQCEGRKDITTRDLMRCKDCGSSSCRKCAGRPEHNFEPLDVKEVPRLNPSTFVRGLKSALPMCISLSGVDKDLLVSLRETSGIAIPEKRWNSWCSAVLRATSSELRFVEPKRQEIWSAIYQSPHASFELHLDPKQTEWRLYAKPSDDEPANAEIRRLLQMPIARFRCEKDLLRGCWQFALPAAREVTITIEGNGEMVPSWEARLGLQGKDFKEKVVHSRLHITIPESEMSHFDRDISGTYVLLDKCGTANSALHKKLPSDDDDSLPPLFMMLDPTRCGNPTDDPFVFTTSTRRYEYGEFRPIICKLYPSWRQSDVQGEQRVKCHVPLHWITSESVKVQPVALMNASFAVPVGTLSANVTTDACASANALLTCTVPLHEDAGTEWPRGEWREVNKVRERGTFKALAWLLERVRHVDDNLGQWQNVEVPDDLAHCQRCAPTPPTVKWTKNGKKVVAIEDTQEAGQYERNLKLRPTPFVTQLKMENQVGVVKVGLNVASILHKALSRLPTTNRLERPVLSWRLDTDFASSVKIHNPPFRLLSNKFDLEHSQPPNFDPEKLPLRIEQLRSLTWMIAREKEDSEPFVEEEISEAVLEPLGWRAEGRAQRPIRIRGGVLADQVGYGKTAITLGLIDCTAKSVKKEFNEKGDIIGKVPVQATLVIVPPHLTRQWRSEAQKFARNRFKNIVVISTAAQINNLTVEDIQDADLVIVASNLFQSTVYLANLEAFAAGGSLPPQDGRYFNARLNITLQSLRNQVERLKSEGSASVIANIQDARKREEELEAQLFVVPKRLVGKAYQEAAAKGESSQAKLKKDDSASEAQIFPAKPTSSGKICEVVITVPARQKRTVVETSDSENSDEPPPRKRIQRKASKKVIVIDSDDETGDGHGSDYEEEGPQDQSDDDDKASKTTRPRSKPSRKPSPPPTSSSDDGHSVGDSSDIDIDEEDEDDGKKDSKGKGKGKGKGKYGIKAAPKRKATKKSTKSSGEDTDSMEVDDPPSSPASSKTSKKRKTTASDDKPAKKQKRREDTDPWKLGTTAVKKDWTQTCAPPLEVFHFSRIVVDEYTYLGGKVHSMVTKLTGDRRWVLSGTPPIHDFGSVKTIAAHLNLHLGIDDDGEGKSAMIKKRIREQTKVEEFHSFREVHTQEWHAHRHNLGQLFLDMFVRQNIAEIDEIPCTFEVVKVVLPAAERAIYLELEHHLRAIDMATKRPRKSESDREKRLNIALGESKNAEEALLKRCSHFDLDVKDKENAMKACEIIVKERTEQLEECKKELLREFQKAIKKEKSIGKLPEESLFQEYVRVSRSEGGAGDREASEIIQGLLTKADVPVLSTNHWKNKAKGDMNLTEKMKEAVWEHREQTYIIHKLNKELIGRVRSLRYFTVVRDLQKQRETPPIVSCSGCERSKVPMDEVAVLSSCGHTGCMKCVKEAADKEECVYVSSGQCKAAARALNIVKGETLGVDDEARDGHGKHYGKKLEMVVDLVKNQIAKKDRVLIFVQFPDLMAKVAHALKMHKIEYLEINGSATQKSKNLEQFQNSSKERVLLLNVMDESASGANLTVANHGIFLSPLLTQSQEVYDACETQAIGRLRRYGQIKHVTIHRFITTDTIDSEIFQERAKVKI